LRRASVEQLVSIAVQLVRFTGGTARDGAVLAYVDLKHSKQPVGDVDMNTLEDALEPLSKAQRGEENQSASQISFTHGKNVSFPPTHVHEDFRGQVVVDNKDTTAPATIQCSPRSVFVESNLAPIVKVRPASTWDHFNISHNTKEGRKLVGLTHDQLTDDEDFVMIEFSGGIRPLRIISNKNQAPCLPCDVEKDTSPIQISSLCEIHCRFAQLLVVLADHFVRNKKFRLSVVTCNNADNNDCVCRVAPVDNMVASSILYCKALTSLKNCLMFVDGFSENTTLNRSDDHIIKVIVCIGVFQTILNFVCSGAVSRDFGTC